MSHGLDTTAAPARLAATAPLGVDGRRPRHARVRPRFGRLRTGDTIDQRRALADAQALTARMTRMVTGLLARARTQTGLAEVESIALRLDQLTESVVAESGTENVTLTTEPTVVQGDPELLALVVRNLIDNAATHGAAPYDITVAGGRVMIRDRAPGLDPAIADPFDRGVTGPTGKHGIGLAIVAWVALLHHGTATLESAAGGGAVATLALTPSRVPPVGD